MSGSPAGWASARIGDVAASIFDGPFGSALKTSDYTTEGFRVARLENIGHLRFRKELTSFVSEEKFATLSRHVLNADDVLFSSFVDKQTRVCLVPGELGGRMINKADCFCVRTNPEAYEPRLLACRLAAPASYAAFSDAVRGVTRPRIGLKDLSGYEIEVPPLAEQRRIVAKLDALTARTARARADLDRIPALAARYKQAVLTKAFSGELTEAAGTWPTKTVGEVINRVVGGKNLRCEERPPRPDELGVVKVSAVSWGAFNPEASKTLPTDFSPPEHTRISRGDFLISRANTLELVGAVVVVDQTPDNLFLSDKVLRLEMPDERKHWIMWFLRSPEGRAAIEAGSSGNQLSMRNLSQDALRKIRVPWPDRDTQLQIVGRIERAFTEIDRLTVEAAAARRLLDRLDQEVLAKAFRGELVPQDPADEPASVLLNRIRAERAAAPKASRSRKRAVAEAS